MVISHNMGALNAQRQFGIKLNNKTKAAEKLSSGYQINRAADDGTGESKCGWSVGTLTIEYRRCTEHLLFLFLSKLLLKEYNCFKETSKCKKLFITDRKTK